MSNTQPLTPPVDLASQLALVQQQLLDTARKAKAIAFAALDQSATANILQLAEDIRRDAAITGTHVVDLQNAATRAALRSGASLPSDPSASASATQIVVPVVAAEEDTSPPRVGGFLQETT